MVTISEFKPLKTDECGPDGDVCERSRDGQTQYCSKHYAAIFEERRAADNG